MYTFKKKFINLCYFFNHLFYDFKCINLIIINIEFNFNNISQLFYKIKINSLN